MHFAPSSTNSSTALIVSSSLTGSSCDPSCNSLPGISLTICKGTSLGGLTQKNEFPYPSGTDCRAISIICLKPFVTKRPRPSNLCSKTALVATVDPCKTISSEEVLLASVPITLSIEFNKPTLGSFGVEEVLTATISPVTSSMAMISVNVPPVSIASLLLIPPPCIRSMDILSILCIV